MSQDDKTMRRRIMQQGGFQKPQLQQIPEIRRCPECGCPLRIDLQVATQIANIVISKDEEAAKKGAKAS